MFTKDDTIRYFMLTYCYTKWWYSDPVCKEYFNKKCHEQKQGSFTDDCKAIGLKKFKSKYDGRVCLKSFFSRMTIANRDSLETETQPSGLDYSILKPIVNYTSVLILLIMMVWMSRYHEVQSDQWDTDYTTASDYSVLLKGLPKKDIRKAFNQINIKMQIESRLRSEGLNITDMSFVYDTEEFLKLKKEYTDAKTELAKQQFLEASPEFNKEEDKELLEKIPKKVEKLKKQILKEKERFDDFYAEGMTGAVFVSFLTSKEASEFYERYKKTGFFYKRFQCAGYQKEVLEVKFPAVSKNSLNTGDEEFEVIDKIYKLYAEKPPEPGDVIWENQGYTSDQKFWRRNVVNLLTLLVFGIGFILLMGLKLAFVS